jgi:biopolymer transport protein ExbD
MIQFACTNCSKSLQIADEFGGRKVKCPKCGIRLVVPQSVAAHVAPPAAAAHDDEYETAKFARPHEEEGEMIDMTAMVDIVFLLLIFFLVTSVQSIQASLEMPTPDPEQSSSQGRVTMESLETNDDYIVVRIDRDNTVWVNESEAPSRQETILKLRDAKEEGGSSMVVMASGDCKHETVVMVLDSGAAAGIDDVRLANLGDDE